MNNFKLEFLLLVRNRAVLLLCATYFLFAVIALVLGAQRYYLEHNQIAKLEQRYAQDLTEWTAKVEKKGPGYAAYYLFNPVVFTPSPWSALFSGERKESLAIQRVRMLAVHGQIHGSAITNSEHSVLGVLDVQFVWLYLLPLLVGLLCVTCIADDRRLGRWPLLRSLSTVKNITAYRLGVRFVLISALNILIFFCSFFFLPLSLDSNAILVLLALGAYQIFWFVCSAIIMYLFLNARQSILTFVGFWVVSVWLVPAIHYNAALDSETYNAGVEMLVEQRQDMNDSWDRDKKADFQQFLQLYPEWQATQPLGESFEWKWYFAMQKRSDDQVTALAEQYSHNKSNTASIWLWLSPTLVSQKIFEDIANTGAEDFQVWINEVVEWHGKLQSFWFPYLFLDSEFKPSDLGEIPEFSFSGINHSSKTFYIYWACVLLLCSYLLFLINRRSLNSN